jgi:hypothetical protein
VKIPFPYSAWFLQDFVFVQQHSRSKPDAIDGAAALPTKAQASMRMHLKGLEPHETREKWLRLCTGGNAFTNGATICHWRRHKVSQCHITRNLVSLVPTSMI